MSNPVVRLALFLVLCVGGGIVIGASNVPGAWHAALVKPSFNPPNWVFGPVWTVLYILIAVTGFRTFQRDATGTAMWIWWTQLALNFAWSPTFFGAHLILAALVVVIGMWISIVAFIAVQWSRDRVAALLFVPYALWVSFAALLNGAIWRLN